MKIIFCAVTNKISITTYSTTIILKSYHIVLEPILYPTSNSAVLEITLLVQDRMIPSLINYIEVLYQKKFYYGSCHDIITEQNNVLLEKATVDVDKDI